MATNNLQEILDDIGWSQADLAKKSGVSAGIINKYCTKKRTPTPKTQTKLAKAISEEKKVSPADIFGQKKDK